MKNDGTKATAKRVLLCGGSGFIGRRLAHRLLAHARELDILVHRTPFDSSSQERGVRLLQGDLLDPQSLRRVLDGVDTVVNLVGAYSRDIYSMNVVSVANLLEACKAAGTGRLIFASSNAVYGQFRGQPFREDDELRPVSNYGLAKVLGETVCRFYAEERGIQATVLRLSNVYGPGQKAGVVFNFIDAIRNAKPVVVNNGGTQKRDFLFVDDAVDGIVRAIDHRPVTEFEAINISGPEPRTLLDVLSVIEKGLQRKVEVVQAQSPAPDEPCLWSNCDKAGKLLEFKAGTSLEQGIPGTLEHFGLLPVAVSSGGPH